MRMGILTGGGDVPGLNACIKAAVNRALDDGHEFVGIRRGWAGLFECNPDDPESVATNIVPLDRAAVRIIDRSGGTFLHTSRTNPAKVKPRDVPEFLRTPDMADAAGDEPGDYTEHIRRVIDALGIDVLLPIGGDDTLSYALRLHHEGVPLVAIPKTMDNDVHGTDYCIGFSTAVTRSVQLIHQLRTSTGSHERIGVIELFGRYSGETSLISAYVAGVDRAIISEVEFDIEKLARLLMHDKRSNPSNYAMMTISEGATLQRGRIVQGGPEDAYGHQKLGGVGLMTGELLKEITGEGIVYQQLGYLMRSGTPDSLDLMVSTNYAVMAVDLAIDGLFGRMVSLRNGIYTNVPLEVTREGAKRVDVSALYDVDEYRPKIRNVDGQSMFLS